MTLAGIKGYSSLDFVRTKYRGAKIIECDDDLTALLKVSASTADGAIVDYMVASYLIDKYSITNLKYPRELDFYWDLRFAINKKCRNCARFSIRRSAPSAKRNGSAFPINGRRLGAEQFVEC